MQVSQGQGLTFMHLLQSLAWICFFQKHLLSAYCVPGLAVSAGDTAMNATDKNPWLFEIYNWAFWGLQDSLPQLQLGSQLQPDPSQLGRL